MISMECEIAIIGGGCIGASILFELCQRGFRDVALVDQGRRTLSATSQSGGMIRVFHENPRHLDLALANLTLLDLYLRKNILSKRIDQNGGLYFFKQNRIPSFSESLHKMREASYNFEIVDAEQGARRFPQFQWAPDDVALFEPWAGHLSPLQFSDDLFRSSRSLGARIFEDFEVNRICPYLDRYRLSGNEGTLTARVLILAGGARLLPRLRDCGLFLPLEAKTVTAYVAERNDEEDIMPNYFDRETLEFARFGRGKEVVLSGEEPSRLKEKKWGKFLKVHSAPDCYAPGRLGVMGRVPGLSNLILATGWGGTGFKFALAVGRQVARALENEFPERRGAYAGV